MDGRVKEFRKLAAAFGAGKGRRPAPYPERCRKLALDYAQEQVEKGATLQSVGEALGVTPQTLSQWRRRYGDEVRPVRVSAPQGEPELEAEPEAPSAERPSLVVVLRSGTRIEGLDLEGVVAVLRAVG